MADTALQKSLRQFSKYWWPNQNYGKMYIFKSNTFSMLKITFFVEKLENAHRGPAPLDSYPENYLHVDISS